MRPNEIGDEWQRAYERVYDGVPAEEVACPGCGRFTLRLIFVGSPEDRLASGYFWCAHQLVGIVISRTCAPEDAVLLDRRLAPQQLDEQIPDFEVIRPGSDS